MALCSHCLDKVGSAGPPSRKGTLKFKLRPRNRGSYLTIPFATKRTSLFPHSAYGVIARDDLFASHPFTNINFLHNEKYYFCLGLRGVYLFVFLPCCSAGFTNTGCQSPSSGETYSSEFNPWIAGLLSRTVNRSPDEIKSI